MPNLTALKPLFPYYRRYRSQMVAGLVFVVLSTAITSVVPWLLRNGIDEISAGRTGKPVYMVFAAIMVTALVGGVLRYGMREVLNGVSRRIEFDLRNDLYQHLQSLDASYFGKTRTGDLMARLTNDLGAVRMAAGPAVMYLTNTIAGTIFALYFMAKINVLLTFLSLIPLSLLPIVTVKLGSAIHTRFDAVQEHFSSLTTHAQENLSGTRIVRAYRQEAAEIARFGQLNEEYLRRNIKLARLWGIMHPLFALFGGLASVVVLGVGGYLAIQDKISVGGFVAFIMYLAMLAWPLIALGWVVNLFQRGSASMARLTEIFVATPSIDVPDSPLTLPKSKGGRTIEFRNVGFKYPPRGENEAPWVLRNVSFSVPAGATLGVVGATGSGKSALVELIARIYDPQEGQILIDGVNIRQLSIGELRREISFVPQESLLFSETIRANIAYGALEPDSVEWAADVAQLSETIREFPGGYDTQLGERGINLSGGQKQRAALARALARKPPIVVLDDALSAVDTQTEAAILRELRGALEKQTTVIASHRITAIRDADWIVVLDDGKVVERGVHDELLAARGKYWTLLRRQQLEASIEGDTAIPLTESATPA
ncbi:MAG: ABC transporter ATP-binding protein [Gemmatimonadaceae bacterium]|nr:ABC transporter ATP-binding protein [Gemmatimonadaceae bacterium]